MKKIVAAALLLTVCTLPASAKMHFKKFRSNRPQAIHEQNPHIMHPVRLKPHPVAKQHA
jgi:hypothetical protein